MDRCRLYLAVPGAPDPASSLSARLREALRETDIACVLLARPETGPFDPDWVRDARALCQSSGVATLIEGEPDLAKSLGLDGVHVTGIEAYGTARGVVGSGVIVGALAGLSRHDAMVLAERGADYVALGDGGGGAITEAMVSWWAELVEIPCVAWQAADADGTLRLASRGADFVCLGTAIWDGPNPSALVAELDHALRGLPSAA